MKNLLAASRRISMALSKVTGSAIASLHTVRRSQTVAVVTCAAMVSVLMTVALASARAARDNWDATSRVLVTSGWVDAGETLDGSNTRTVPVPVALVADDALALVPDGASLRVGLAPGTALTESMIVATAGAMPIPEGWRVVAMGVDVAAPMLVPGDRVDVVAADKVLAADAIVTVAATESQGPAVAVPQEVAAVVATAARDGLASLVLAG